MTKLTELTRFDAAQDHYSSAKLWELFDGDLGRLNIATECIDRHADSGRDALRIVNADGSVDILSFADLAEQSSRFAHWLVSCGIRKGDRVAFMLEPSRAFYVSLFGALKCGAISVPLFTLFGPEGLRLRLDDCAPSLLIVAADKLDAAAQSMPRDNIVLDRDLERLIAGFPGSYACTTSASDLAVFQYTSGTTRELPEAVRHTHRALVVLMAAALYGTGIRPGDEFFCPSSPAWGHGLWHGTLAPLALGVTTGSFAGKFDANRLVEALEAYRITNMSAAATHYRMIRNSGSAEGRPYAIRKLSFTGEPIDPETQDYIEKLFDAPLCSMYGTTEIGVILANYPGAEDFAVRRGALGKPLPGMRIEIRRPDGSTCAPDEKGEIMLYRKEAWLPTKDLGWVDAEGYFYHGGRADDVIISAGWTMSAVEIEQTLLAHPTVQDVAVIGVPDDLRGLVVKAFVVTNGTADQRHIEELQQFTRKRLSLHEYPRQIEFVSELIKTPAGKINRKALRDREALKLSEGTVQ